MGQSKYAEDIGNLNVAVGQINTTLQENLPDIKKHLAQLNGTVGNEKLKLALTQQRQDLCPWLETTPSKLREEITHGDNIMVQQPILPEWFSRNKKLAAATGVTAAVFLMLMDAVLELWRFAEQFLERISQG